MRAIRTLTALGFTAALAFAGPASAVTSVKIVAADGTWLGAVSYVSYGMMVSVVGDGWGCGGASTTPGQFMGGASGAQCGSTGSGTVYMSGGEWWIDYP